MYLVFLLVFPLMISISLDSDMLNLENDNYLRAYVSVFDLNVSDGYYFMEILNSTDNIISKQQIIIQQKQNDQAGAHIGVILDDIPEGQYKMKIYTEFGNYTAIEPFNVTNSEIVSNISEPSILPDWIKQVFEMYSQGQISDKDLINVLEFLINEGIIKL